MPLASTAAGAPYALATSARSNVLRRYEGGVGHIVLHGIGNLATAPWAPRRHTAACAWATRRWLGWRACMPAGVPITIRSR